MHEQDYGKPWPRWQRIAFRFLFCYLSLHVFSWAFFTSTGIGVLDWVAEFIIGGSVNAFNRAVMHFPGPFPNPDNMNDSPYRFTQVTLYLCVSVLATAIWSLFSKKKSHYIANYYFTTLLRYYVGIVSFVYGTIKFFALQMPAPGLADLAIPLGDLSPMMLTWQQIGYSTPYEIFLGATEVAIGVLLLFSRTTPLGLFIALPVYVNIMFINYCYDVWVKVYSTHLVIICLYLLLPYFKRLGDFFIYNRPTLPISHYNFLPAGKMAQLVRKILKGVFILAVAVTFVHRFYRTRQVDTAIKPIPAGVYAVTTIVKNGDTLPVLAHDSIMWKDFIFEPKGNRVVVNSSDTIFRKWRSRGSFRYNADTVNKNLYCYKIKRGKKTGLFVLHYNFPRPGEVELRTRVAADSLYLKLVKNNHKYRLGEKQFHWFSDYRQ